ncbi:MAG: tetratricopeptide repeat protein [bacterium]|nr:tetratricopeptide repeat protein [bacterium]
MEAPVDIGEAEAARLKTLQREVTFFRLMREALGNRDDIVRILDWNFDQAPYYLESEYTEGGDLQAWAESRGGLAAMPMVTRLELVAQVADALAAAHSVGILHKDVKPANVLITVGHDGEPRARLTDFGVGLLADESLLPAVGVTLSGITQDDDYSSAGTQLYQAPEILEGKLPTVQADLYALGVLLFQMVVGDFRRAVAGGWHREIDDEVLRDDIACFVDGSPERRPGSASEIAERLRGIEERRERRRQRERERRQAEEAQKALERGRRRRFILIAALAILTVFATAMSLQVRRTREAAQRAEREAQAARQVSGFLEELFEVVDPGESRGSEVTAREILDQGARRVEDELRNQPDIRARLMNVMGTVYRHLGDYETAQGLGEQALETRRGIHGAEHPEVAESLNHLGRLLFVKGEHETAKTLLRQALAMRRELLGDDHLDVAETLCELSNVLIEKAEADEAEELARQCLAIRRGHFDGPHDKVAESLFTLAVLEHYRDPRAAEEHYAEALAIRRSAKCSTTTPTC